MKILLVTKQKKNNMCTSKEKLGVLDRDNHEIILFFCCYCFCCIFPLKYQTTLMENNTSNSLKFFIPLRWRPY